MKKVLIISFTNLESDPRVNRQIRFLKDNYEVTALGLKDPNIDGVKFIDCGRVAKTKGEKLKGMFKLLSGRFEQYYWCNVQIEHCLRITGEVSADIIIANDIESLPLALRIANDAKVVFDAHEYAPKEFEDILWWKILYQKYKTYLCKTYIQKATKCITVCEGIAEKYKNEFRVNFGVITNAPYLSDCIPCPINGNKIRLILHSGANPSRKIENIIKLMDLLDDRFSLDLMLIGSESYINKLKKMAKNKNTIRFIPPVSMSDIVAKINNYDIGVYILEPNSFNNKMALPNKFFEFIQAGLTIAIGPSPEMVKFIKKYDCGIIAEDFQPTSMAKVLNRMDAQSIIEHKKNSYIAAKTLCAENNKAIFLELLNKL